MSRWVVLLVEATVDFTITAGSSLLGYMTAQGTLTLPSRAAVIVAVVSGLVGAANQVRGVLRRLTEGS